MRLRLKFELHCNYYLKDQGVSVFPVPNNEMDNRRTKQLHLHDNKVKVILNKVTPFKFLISAA